ncbi:MAG: alpha/beta hydrolase [Leptolyngbya sp.]|nr:alpha/beta hydrolase [Candidatus Melainabacteria bacterium]
MRCKRFAIAMFLILYLLGIFCCFPSERALADDIAMRTATVCYVSNSSRLDQLQCLDVYSNRDARNWPVVVMIHGGAWRSGDKSQPQNGRDKARFLLANGFVFVSVNYRLAPEFGHPSQIKDIAAALAWVSKNISKYGGNPAKVIVMGHSAGAHLACLAVTNQKFLKDAGFDVANVCGCILLDAPTFNVVVKNRYGNFSHNSEIIDDTIFGVTEDQRKEASPALHIAENSYIPTFLALSTPQYLYSKYQAKQFVRDLNSVRHKAEYFFISHKNHVALNSEFGVKKDWVTAKVLAFLNRATR